MQSTRIISKPLTPSLVTGRVTCIALETLQPAISGCFVGADAVFTADELGYIFGKNSRTVYHYGTGQVRLSLDQFATLVRESARRGNCELLDLLTPDIEPGNINGDVDDDLGELIEHEGKMRRAFILGKWKESKSYALKMQLEVTDVLHEIEAKQ